MSQETSSILGTELRQRTSNATQRPHEHRSTSSEPPNSSGMSTARGIALTVSLLGLLSFSVLGMSFGSRYAFFGFHGNMEEAAKSCWETAILFAVIAVFSAFPSITGSISAKLRRYSLDKKHKLPGGYRS